MSQSNPTVNTQNIVLSPMQVFVGPDLAHLTDLGGTTEGVTLSVKYEHGEVMVDQFGKTVLDMIISGQGFGVKFALAETGDKSKWKQAFPSAKLITTSTGLVYFDMQIGDSLLGHAQYLVLHPISKAPGDHSEDITIFKAACKSASEAKYGPDKQTGLNVDFMVFPDQTSTPQRFMIYGDSTIGVVNASAASPVAGGGNVGNGAVTLQAASNQFSKTETITALKVGTGAASADVWTVTGSVSGLIGEFTLAAAPASVHNFAPLSPLGAIVTFTLTQGATQFAVGDTFTIAMTGANYS